jgi:hypothetical protein
VDRSKIESLIEVTPRISEAERGNFFVVAFEGVLAGSRDGMRDSRREEDANTFESF